MNVNGDSDQHAWQLEVIQMAAMAKEQRLAKAHQHTAKAEPKHRKRARPTTDWLAALEASLTSNSTQQTGEPQLLEGSLPDVLPIGRNAPEAQPGGVSGKTVWDFGSRKQFCTRVMHTAASW